MDQHQINHVRRKYKDKMLNIAFIVSTWSSQPDGERHGTVLAVDGKYIVATGFNGPDRNWRWPMPLPRVVHSEENAILNAKMVGAALNKCVAFVTKRPCDECMELLRSEGIPLAFWLQDLRTTEAIWTA